MNYYDDIKNILIDDLAYARVKDYSKERHRVISYFEIGKLLSEAGKHYGENIIGEYSKKLMNEVGKKYTKSTLFRMKQFYQTFNDSKVATLWRQLTWSHIKLIIPMDNIDSVYYYSQQVFNRKLSVRKLESIIKNREYERLSKEAKNKIVSKQSLEITDYIKNPITIKNNITYDHFSEKVLKQLILENLGDFLDELGEGFSFVRDEYKIKMGEVYNYIDLLLYNIKYRCYVVVELKITELKKEHTGQIQTYMNFIDQNIKSIYDDKTVGIIICKEENEYVIRYCSDKRIISRRYSLV